MNMKKISKSTIAKRILLGYRVRGRIGGTFVYAQHIQQKSHGDVTWSEIPTNPRAKRICRLFVSEISKASSDAFDVKIVAVYLVRQVGAYAHCDPRFLKVLGIDEYGVDLKVDDASKPDATSISVAACHANGNEVASGPHPEASSELL